MRALAVISEICPSYVGATMVISICVYMNEGSNAELEELIAGTKFSCFLTPHMAPKNDARHVIGFT